MKRFFIFSLTALLFSTFAFAGNNSQNVEAIIIAKVQTIYADVNKVYGNNCDINLDLLYTSKDWQETYSLVEELDNQKETAEEMFFIEDMRWTNAMEPPLRVANVKVNFIDDITALVYFDLYEKNDDYTCECIRMVYEDGEWKVDDWLSPWSDWDLLKSMKDYIENGGRKTSE